MVSPQERIALLRSLGHDPRTPTAEATASLAAAARIMHKYGISEAGLESSGAKPPESCVADRENPLYSWGQRSEVWKRRLASFLCDHYGVAFWELRKTSTGLNGRSTRSSQLLMCGRPSDMASVRDMYSKVVSEALRLSITECKGMGRIYAASWLRGFVRGVVEKLREAKEQAKAESKQGAGGATSAAIVLWENRSKEAADALARHVPNLETIPSTKSYVRDADAYHLGRNAGRNVHTGEVLPETGS